MKNKRLVAMFCIVTMMMTLLAYIPAFSAIEAGKPGAIDYYKGIWQGKEWLLSNITLDNEGNKVQGSFINEKGNLELFSFNEKDHDRVYAQFPYSVNEDGTISSYDTGNQMTFVNEANFDVDFKMRYEGKIFFYLNWYHGGARLEFKDNRITYDDGGGDRRSIKIQDDGKWHNYTVKVRGNRCDNKASSGPDCVRFVTVFMDGRELFNFYSTRRAHSYRNYKFYADADYDQASWGEVEYVNITDKFSSVKVNSHISGAHLEAGQNITLTADAGAADEEKKNVDFYVNGVKVGTGIDQGKITTTESDGCNGPTEKTDPAKDAAITILKAQAGVYSVKAVCDGVESPDVTLFVGNTLTAELNVPQTADSDETVTLNVETSGYPTASRVEYYVNSVCVAESATGGNFEANVSGLPVGTASVQAKVYAADGTLYTTAAKKVKVTANDMNGVKFNREYQIDYTVGNDGNIQIKDGYFELNLNHSGDEVSYKDKSGETKLYSGKLGAGDYTVVVTSGNAEVYYSGQFAFALLMPNCSEPQTVNHSGVTNFVFGGSGVKPTYFRKEWGAETEFFRNLSEFGNYFSVEFDKKDTSAEELVVYDGLYEIVVNMDENGIVVNRQSTVGAPTEKYKLADSFASGYYRITVAEGMAQILCDNEVLGTWRSPLYSGSPSIKRCVSNPSATSFVEIKGTDDVYYHNEDFEGNIEEGFTAEDYWYDETDGRIESEEIEARYKHEIVTEGGKSYLKMTGEGTYFLNVSAYNPSFKWRSYFDGIDGEFAIRFRDAVKFDYSEIGYNPEVGQWYAQNSNKSLVTIKDEEDSDGDGDTTETLKSYYESKFTELATSDGKLDSGWHDFELVCEDSKITLLCDGESVISADGFRNSFGKIGFKISGSGSLGIDDVKYSGEGRATASLSYITGGRSDFYRNFQDKIIAASAGSGMSWFESEDNGETWKEIVGENGQWLGTRSGNNITLLSGKLLRVRYSGKYTYAYLYDETTFANRNDIAKGTEYIPSTSYGSCVEAAGSMDNVPYSGMPSRLMQIKSGPYKGRVIYCRGGSGEIYGRTFMYWSDDYDGIDDPASNKAVWHAAEIQLSYFNTGHNIQESLMVDMPDGTLRYYVRTEMGHLAYFTSSDGGETWDNPIEMKTENLIAPLCCYSIQRKGDTDTYYAFWEYDVITANLTYLESPRNRRALAVSYDGMQTWEYVADIEEEGRVASSTSSVCNHGMRYLDGAVYMSYYHGNDLHKMFRIDETKMKPLKRFTALHYRSQTYASVKDREGMDCVIPKRSGDAKVYGNYMYTEVNASGLADANIVAKAVSANLTTSGNSATLTMGDATVTFTNGSKQYTVNGETKTADVVCCESGYLDVKIVAEIFGKCVTENNNFYVISRNELIENIENQLAAVESGINAEETTAEKFVEMVNLASSKDDAEGIYAAFNKYNHLGNFSVDSLSANEIIAVCGRMTGIEYGSVENVETVYKRALEEQAQLGKHADKIVISTVSGGYEKWNLIGANNGTVNIEDGIATLNIKKGTDAKFAYGTSAFAMPDDEFIFTFDYMLIDGEKDIAVKIGNGEDLVNLEINPEKITVDLGSNKSVSNVKLEENKWYTFKGYLKSSDGNKIFGVTIDDGADMKQVICEDAAFSKNHHLLGFWIESEGVEDSKVKIRNVRVYKERAVDVISYSAENGTASAMVDFLNNEEKILGASAEKTDAIWVDEDFSEDVDFTDGVKFSRSTSMNPEHYTVDVKDGAMHMYKSIDGDKTIEQRILLPTHSSDLTANDMIFEYDMMMPDPTVWTQKEGESAAFMYFDIYVNHPVKAMRQTMYIYKERLKVGSMPYDFKSICGTSNYGGVWMSFKHHYYFENDEWKCNFYYKKRSDTEWIKGSGAAMNASTNRNNFVRFHAYPEDQVEICVDNVKVHYVGEDINSGQLVMGLYNGDRQSGVGYSPASTETIGAYEIKRFTVENVNYNEEGVVPTPKFFIWNNLEEQIPLVEITNIK